MKNYIFAGCLAGIAALCHGSAANATPVIFNSALAIGNQSGFDLGMDFSVNSPVTVTALGTFDANLIAQGVTTGTLPATQTQIANSLLAGPNSSGVNPNIRVGIFDVTTGGNEITPTAVFNNTGALAGAGYTSIGGSIFQNLATGIALTPGQTYSIVASGYTSDYQSGNVYLGSPTPTFDALGGELTLLPGGVIGGTGARFNGAGGNGGEPFSFPTLATGYTELGGSPDFLAGTFEANAPSTTASVPDGGLTIVLLGFALSGIEGLRRKFTY
jgi:hypothetical protein